MALKKKPVTGMKDILPKEMAIRDYVIRLIKETYGTFGFTSMETPCVEHIENLNSKQGGDNEHYTHRIGRTGRAKKEGVSYLFYVPEEKKRVQELLRLTRNTDLCTPVHFDFNHEHIVVEKKQDSADRFQIKCYF